MKWPAKCVACLLPLLLTGCSHQAPWPFHRTPKAPVQTLAPPIEDALPPIPVPSPTDLPPAVVTVPIPEPAPATKTQLQPAPKPPVRHKKPVPAPPAGNTQLASNESPGVSAIGQLSMGEPSDLQQQTANSIASIERSLNSITRKLSDQEQKTADHIREFLKKAREAQASGDTDGAHTLALKAKVLLDELLK
jgi:hypothetical protein